MGNYINKKPILGYGFYNDIIAKELGYGNPQNAILKFLLDVGIVGLVLYGIMVWKSFKGIDSPTLYKVYPMVGFYYAMIMAGLVEINLTHMVVFMAMAIVYSGSKHIHRRLVI